MAKNQQPTSGVVVIGLGRFGSALALELESDGVEVLAIDTDLKRVQAMSGRITHVVQADSTDAEEKKKNDFTTAATNTAPSTPPRQTN